MGPSDDVEYRIRDDADRYATGKAGDRYAKARTLADEWLKQFRPELRTGQVHAFPGYYTFHTMRDGAIAGTLSVH
ncbi:hypothetical protein ONR57_01480 [Hoyosella sp. YIM 151337]|uniref:hypothetical protein n=1 Tax=Hoyosella sp. YIM 151337 TaxID=2992742 RepID=UPI002236BD6F|nr:hypothetical protein [Hoyosella sp. YIM 151337]MCW4351971.1 hypothetical protein [Hoyosella sp. YIM 151337]